MAIAQTFEPGAESEGRLAEVARLRLLVGDTLVVPARDSDTESDGSFDDGVPVLPCLQPLVPGGVLQRGSVVAVPDRSAPWPGEDEAPSYLAAALSVGASAAGAWCAVVGLPALGIAAAVGLGADPDRLVLLDDPADRWPEAVGVLAGAVDLILLRPTDRPTAETIRRITARLRTTPRQRGAVLIVAGPWTGAHLTLRTTQTAWRGLGVGTGHLTDRRITVAIEGRGANNRQRTSVLWLPAAAEDQPSEDQPTEARPAERHPTEPRPTGPHPVERHLAELLPTELLPTERHLAELRPVLLPARDDSPQDDIADRRTA